MSFEVHTRRRAQLVNITDKVSEAVERSGVREGICHVFIPHTTAGVTVNEGADPDVAADIESLLAELVPKEAAFEHAEGNSDSHIKAMLSGPPWASGRPSSCASGMGRERVESRWESFSPR